MAWAAVVAIGLSIVSLPTGTASAAAPTGYLRVGHFVPGAAAASIELDGRLLVSALSFQQVSSYVAVPAGPHTLQITVPSSGGAPPSVNSAAVAIAPGQFLTVLVVADSAHSLHVTSFTDNLGQPPPGDAKVRIIDTLATVPALGGNLSMAPGPAVPDAVAVPAVPEGAASPYMDVEAGTYNVTFSNATTGASVLSGNDWPVAAGTVASLVVLQGPASPSLEVLKDAVGSASLPTGGMQTGAGGMALRGRPGSDSLELALGGVFVVALVTVILARRRRASVGVAAMACATGLVVTSCGSESPRRVTIPSQSTPTLPTISITRTGTTKTGRTAWSPPAATSAGPDSSAAPLIDLAAAGTADPSNQPERIAAPAVGINASIVNLGRMADGTMQVPTDFGVAGWYDEGPAPGEPGPAVIIGHVDSTTGPAVFWRLSELRPGDRVIVTSAQGTETFAVTLIQSVSKDDFPTARVFGPVADAELRLITCGGPFDRATGHYLDNTVVFASQIAG